MKNINKKILIIFCLSLLTACQNIDIDSSYDSTSFDSNYTSETTSSESTSENIDVDDKPFGVNETILHAWNWSMDNIKDNLEAIKQAGFTAVQTSPMQPQKDYYPNGNYKNEWWKLYQPLGFSIATKNHSIGTKQDLEELCIEANSLGIKIIVDIVSNHLGGGNEYSFNSNVREYEPEIYDNNLLHGNNFYVDDNSIEKVTKGNLGGYPDLQTESIIVQEAVLDLLKEYVDVGVSGFRFDAAKHIETDEDGIYSSNYWEYVIGGINSYCEAQNKDEPFIYGEILNTPGVGRTYEAYTKRMSVTDNNTSTKIREGVVNNNIDDASYQGYVINQDASKIVLWGESHDTFANDSHETTYISQENIDKAYAIETSKNNASVLYFPRPSSDSVKMGEITNNTTWNTPLISAINNFHNDFYGYSDNITSNNGYFINVRENNNSCGVLIVDINDTSPISDLTLNINDGQYIDKITDDVYEIKNGKIVTEGNNDILVLYPSNYIKESKPAINIHDDGTTFITDTLNVNISVINADESYYTVNDSSPIYFTNSIDLTIEKTEGVDEYKLNVYASNQFGEVEEERTYRYVEFIQKDILVENIPIEYVDNDIYAWVWPTGSGGRWIEGVLFDTSFTFDIEDDDSYFLLAVFPSNSNFNQLSWDNVISQTDDIFIDSSIYDASNFGWVNK